MRPPANSLPPEIPLYRLHPRRNLKFEAPRRNLHILFLIRKAVLRRRSIYRLYHNPINHMLRRYFDENPADPGRSSPLGTPRRTTSPACSGFTSTATDNPCNSFSSLLLPNKNASGRSHILQLLRFRLPHLPVPRHIKPRISPSLTKSFSLGETVLPAHLARFFRARRLHLSLLQPDRSRFRPLHP